MQLRHSVSRAWAQLLYDQPVAVLVLSILLTSVVPLGLLYFFPVKLSPNAEVGFDTSNTPYSGQRQAWKKLSLVLQTTNRVELNSTLLNSTTNAKKTKRDLGFEWAEEEKFDIERWKERTEAFNLERTSLSPIRAKRAWTDRLAMAFGNVPCYEAPIPLMNHLSQVVLEVPSYEFLWDVSFLQKLCGMQSGISEALKPFENYTPFRNIWSVANFFACLAPNFLVNCTELTAADVDTVRSLVEQCVPFRRRIVDCRLSCGENCTEAVCPEVPRNCSTAMMSDLFYRLLPMDLNSRPFYINTFLPVFSRMGYATQNLWLPMKDYDALEDAIMNYTSRVRLTVKGLNMELKRDRLLAAAVSDASFSLLAAALVMTCVALHSRSISYALAVLLQLILSVLTALSIYALFTPDFPLLNLVIFVLLIAVGSDDAFLLHSHFPIKLTEEGFYQALSHTSSTMFLTSFSTAVPFFVNILSSVIVFRCFGLFAGLTMIINFLLVISFLPSFLIIQRRWLEPFIMRFFWWIPRLPDPSKCLSTSVKYVLPQVLLQGRLVWLACLLVLSLGSLFVAVRDLSLPQFNPLQLFRADNPHEWYDNHAQPLFEFVEAKIGIPLHARLVWGILPVEQPARFRDLMDPPLRSDPLFSLSSVPDVKRLARTLERFRHLPFVNHPAPYWPENFLTWSSRYSCEAGFLCCNVSSPLFTNAHLDYCLRNSTSYIFTQYNDTPIFDSRDFSLIGYTALLPTQLRYSHRFRNLSASFEQFSSSLQMGGGWFTTEWYLMSTWFDLQRSIVADCQSSVIISLAVVAVLAVLVLHWQAIPCLLCIICIITVSVGAVVLLGWEIGVLEAVILVLVVGLSFDFTLHFGASLDPRGCPSHRVGRAATQSASPVALAALSSVVAGAPMLLCKTHAFFQVGVFLVVSTCVSWLFANFFFLPLLSLTLSRRQHCVECDRGDYGIPMQHKFG